MDSDHLSYSELDRLNFSLQNLSSAPESHEAMLPPTYPLCPRIPWSPREILMSPVVIYFYADNLPNVSPARTEPPSCTRLPSVECFCLKASRAPSSVCPNSSSAASHSDTRERHPNAQQTNPAGLPFLISSLCLFHLQSVAKFRAFCLRGLWNLSPVLPRCHHPCANYPVICLKTAIAS